MTGDGLSLATAFIAGVASVVSPCVIGLLPVYISILSGSAGGDRQRSGALANAIGFTLGFSVVFILLGTGAGAIGSLLPSPAFMRKVAGAAMVIMGLVTAGVLNIGLLASEHKALEMSAPRGKSVGFGSSVLLGVAFSAGWSPCVGPVLASILSIASVSGNPARGAVLLAAYSLGLAVPFLAAAVAIDKFKALLPGVMRVSARLRGIAGIVMVIVGTLYLTGIL